MAGRARKIFTPKPRKKPSRPASAAQKRQIWWLAERVGFGAMWREDEALRWGMIEKFTHGRCCGISELNQLGVQQVIEALIEYGKNRRILASNAQQRKLYKLADLIGLATPPTPGTRRRWDTRRLRAWLDRMFNIRKPVYLTRDEADRAIEALKEMDERGYRVGPRAATATG